MATLETIRKRAGILVSIVIGLALIAFVLGDFLTPGKSMFNSSSNDIGDVKGKKIEYQDYMLEIQRIEEVYKFNSQQQTLDEQTIQSIREQTWASKVEELVMTDEYKATGISVSPEEVYELVQGSNPHQIIQQLFTSQETGQFNRTAVLQFLKTLDQDQTGKRKDFWLYIESEIIRERLMTKYNNLIKKGLYVTKAQVDVEALIESKLSDVQFVMLPYSSISDSLVKVEKSDLKDYLKKHAREFEQEASRDMQYVVFPINPSQDDYVQAEKWILGIRQEFSEATEAKQFVNYNSDVSFNEKYFKQEELEDSLKILYNNTKTDIVGPFFYNGSFKLARIADIKMLPDSVKARHILIKPTAQTSEAYQVALGVADSLKTLIKKGASFDELAKTNSDDGSASKGGDLGWFKEGQMVKPFNDSCFFNSKGKIMIVESQFGVHVVEVTERGKEIKKVQVAVIERKVEPSQTTFQEIFKNASTFAGVNNTTEKFVESAQKAGMLVNPAQRIAEGATKVNDIENSRELIRWAYQAEKGQVSEPMQFGNQFVVANLSAIREKGTPELDDVKDHLVRMVQKQKKGEMLADKMKNGAKSIDELASKLQVVVNTASGIGFNSYVVPNAGVEPAICGAAFVLKPNTISSPIIGSNGVFVINITNQADNNMQNKLGYQMRLTKAFESRVIYESFETLRKLANIKDNRSNFF